jgi:hypothetical protein
MLCFNRLIKIPNVRGIDNQTLFSDNNPFDFQFVELYLQ